MRLYFVFCFFFSSRRRHTRSKRDWSSDVCSSDLSFRGDDARTKGIAKLSDLKAHPELKLGLSQEFIGRADGWPGLKRAYERSEERRVGKECRSRWSEA